jgi:hypothetical protein
MPPRGVALRRGGGGAPGVAHPDPHPALQRLDPSTAFLYAPHTVSVLVAGEGGGAGGGGGRAARRADASAADSAGCGRPPEGPAPQAPCPRPLVRRQAYCCLATTAACSPRRRPAAGRPRSGPAAAPLRACGPRSSCSWVRGGAGGWSRWPAQGRGARLPAAAPRTLTAQPPADPPPPPPAPRRPPPPAPGYSVVQGPRTSMVRPHPAAWRLVHGMLVAYVLLLVFLLFQNVDDARQFLRVRRRGFQGYVGAEWGRCMRFPLAASPALQAGRRG